MPWFCQAYERGKISNCVLFTEFPQWTNVQKCVQCFVECVHCVDQNNASIACYYYCLFSGLLCPSFLLYTFASFLKSWELKKGDIFFLSFHVGNKAHVVHLYRYYPLYNPFPSPNVYNISYNRNGCVMDTISALTLSLTVQFAALLIAAPMGP